MNKHNYSISEQVIIETIKNKKTAQKRLTHAEKEIQSDLLKNLANKKAANKAIRSSLNHLKIEEKISYTKQVESIISDLEKIGVINKEALYQVE